MPRSCYCDDNLNIPAIKSSFSRGWSRNPSHFPVLKPEKPTFLDQEKNMTRKTRKIENFVATAPGRHGLGQTSVVDPLGVQEDAVFLQQFP